MNSFSVKEMVSDSSTGIAKIFGRFIQTMIIISLISFSIETEPEIHGKLRTILRIIEIITVAIFTIEYLLRVIYAKNRFKFIFSFYGIIDILAVLPFYISTGIDLRGIRIFRLLRLLRSLKVFRYSKAMERFTIAFKEIKAEMILFFTATLFVLYVSAIGIYYFENQAQPETFGSIFNCLWWAVVTLTTVGYGDVYPITVGGKIFTSAIIIIGLGIVAVPTGLLASALTKTIENE